MYECWDLFRGKIMITKTTINNVNKYLNEKNIPFENFKNDLQLFEFAKTIRNKEKIAYMKEEKQSVGMKKTEISIILKTELWDERYFLSEGIQEVDYSAWDYADTEIILNGKNYFEYFTSFIDVINGKIIIHFKNNVIKQIKKNELLEIFDYIDLFFVDECKNITKKKAIKVFLIDSVFKKQKYEEIKEKKILQCENNIYNFLNDLKRRNYVCNQKEYSNEKGISGYFLFLDYLDFCKLNKTKPEQKKIFIQECKKNFEWKNKTKRIAKEIIKDTCFFIN